MLPVLMYHHVRPGGGFIAVTPHNFASQMEAMFKAGWQTVDTKGVSAFLAGEPLAPKSFALSFDDGYLDNFRYAFPVLCKYNFHMLLFVVTSWLGIGEARDILSLSTPSPSHRQCKEQIANGYADDVMLRWSEIRKMRDSGLVSVHSHSHSHVSRPAVSNPAMQQYLADDLTRSRKALQEQLGEVSSHYCWPRGQFNDEDVITASVAGFTYQYTTRRGLNRARDVNKQKTPALIERLAVRDKDGGWLLSRLRLFSLPLLGHLYCRRRGDV